MASNETSEGKGVAVTVGIGTEIDRSIGELISALLKPAATELGSLIGDTIGLLSDPIRKKRKLNAEKGLSEVRAKLEASGVEMKDITPPKEEELHLLIEGISLSDDENIRNLWTGIFAEALKPDSGVSAERPFIAVLNSLTGLDAKIIEFLAFVIRTDSNLRREMKQFIPQSVTDITAQDKAQLEEVAKKNSQLRLAAIEEIENKGKLSGLDSLSGSEWSDNLLRQGIVEIPAKPRQRTNQLVARGSDRRAIDEIVEHLNQQVNVLDEYVERNSARPKNLFAKDRFTGKIMLEVQLTEFGERLVKACGLV